jgi:hydrogenase maturation protease
MHMTEKTLVVGLGNPILTDDGVGVIVANKVEKALGLLDLEGVTVTEASVGGLRLMELMIGFDRVILIDAILSSNGAKPGTIQFMSLEDLRDISPTQHSTCAHDTSLITALEFGKHLGLHLPDDIIIYAVEVANVCDFSDQPTPAVAEAVPKVTELVLNELIMN